MAGNAYVKKRLWNPELIVDPTGLLPNLLRNRTDGHFTPTYEIVWKGTTQAGEELGTAATSVKDGTATPFQVNVVSDQADDTDDATKDVRAVALIGITSNSLAGYKQWLLYGETTPEGKAGRPQSTVEVCLMDGIADVLATRWNIWLDALYAVNWGSAGQNAKGNITAESPPNTTLIALIAGKNEGEGGVWHFPPGVHTHIEHVHLTPTEALAAATGVIVTGTWIGVDQVTNIEPDLDVDYYQYTTPSLSADYGHEELTRYTTLATKVTWVETTVTAAKAHYIKIIQSFH